MDKISIHALLAESDYILVNTFLAIFEFLSTLSLRRATDFKRLGLLGWLNFYPRSPCGERPTDAINGCNSDFISIHALLAESDLRVLDGSKSSIEISIHALLAESDILGRGEVV